MQEIQKIMDNVKETKIYDLSIRICVVLAALTFPTPASTSTTL